jgi:hypothetical protein
MKKAVIAVGSHYVGKSKTINIHLKPKLGIGRFHHKFFRNNQIGYILSQSFEEADRDVDEFVKKYSHYELLVLSARPPSETPSCLTEIQSKLGNSGYRVNLVRVIKVLENSDRYYNDRSDEIIEYLDN